MDKHHEILKNFKCYKGEVEAGFSHDFLGVMTRTKYFSLLSKDEYNQKRYVESNYPPFDEEYFEWIDLLEAVTRANKCFAMIELGAGWGRWLCRAVAALRQYDNSLRYQLIGVEAEPKHFQWMIEHLVDNKVDLEKCKLIEAAVNDREGKVRFQVCNAYECYGQRIACANEEGIEVNAVSLNTLLRDLDTVDLIDMDVQGSELIVLSAAAKEINAKVKRVHIGTHSIKNEEELRKLFTELGWHNKYDFTLGKELETEYGTIDFQDGVQSWVNPRFHFSTLTDICKGLDAKPPIRNQQIFEEFDLLHGYPWEETARSDIATYYPCLYGLVHNEKPARILEIGTAFGLSAATLLKASPSIELFVSIDLGIYGHQLGFSQNNIDFAGDRIHRWCSRKGIPLDRIRFYCANTQPEGKGDNENAGVDIARWHQIPELVRLLEGCEFDIVFVDGKHTEDGLLNDLNTFWPFLEPGGLMICDDLHDEATYQGIFPWAGDTIRSLESFLETHSTDISDSYVWNSPQVPPEGYLGLRPFGLIRKKPASQSLSNTAGFETFDSPDAIEINRARQDHLASLGLDLANKSVLEVGSGVGWHTAFFEKLGCRVLSTDAREENVREHRRRFPHRRVEVADLSVPGSHDHFGEFDIVYCYGTLYHLSNPSLCIKELSRICRGLFLVETCVDRQDSSDINLVEEDRNNPNQSFEGVGCRPSRDWVMTELKKYFRHVYLTVFQPNHPEFPLSWPAILPPGVANARSVLVASKVPLNLPTLSDVLLERQHRLEPVLYSKTEKTAYPKHKPDKRITHYVSTIRRWIMGILSKEKLKGTVFLFKQKIRQAIKGIPALGFLIWWAYMILRAPSKISELSRRIDVLENKVDSPEFEDK